ncbi:MAG: hypothetical protein MUP76_07170 [Acidimicrobiia bacterium]|nr:hypothetical protein [Acidimicrobiia bacterium]
MRRLAPPAIPIVYASCWFAAMVLWPVPAVLDWKIIGFMVVLSAAVLAMQAAPLVAPGLREWGLGSGILAALLAPFGASTTVLALFSYTAGDLAPGWAQSWSVRPALVVQGLALAVVIAGLLMQRDGRSDESHVSGRWMVLGGTLVGAAAAVGHLYAVAFDVV